MGKTYRKPKQGFDDDYDSFYRNDPKIKKSESKEFRKQRLNRYGEEDDDNAHGYSR